MTRLVDAGLSRPGLMVIIILSMTFHPNLTCIARNFIGDALRDASETRLQRR
jgi:hypothetical protein